MFHAVLHFGLYAALCLAPALILIPVRVIDQPPSNEITHEQGDGGGDPDGALAAA